MAGFSLTQIIINDPPIIAHKHSTTKQTMELIAPDVDEVFLARYAFKRNMPVIYPHVVGTPISRFQLPLIDGNPSDEALCQAFDCNDGDDTFRGHLRQAVDHVKEHALTSLCGWRMGGERDTIETADLTLLVTVAPASTSQAEAIRMIEKLREVLRRHSQQLAASVAVEVTEQTVELASHEPISANTDQEFYPSCDSKTISFQACAGSGGGASIGLEGTSSVGTLGAVLRIRVDGMADEYVGMTCSHVVSATTRPVVTAPDSETEPQYVVCPSDRDDSHWWKLAKQTVDLTPPNHPRAVRAQTERQQLVSFKRSLGATYAYSGVSSSFDDHWIRDWALIKFDPTRVTSVADLSNVPTEETKDKFETMALNGFVPDGVWRGVDWERGAHRYLTTAELRTQEKEKNICVKVGRTTGHTVGRIHRIDPSLTIRCSLVSPDGKEKEAIELKGKALVVDPDANAGPFAKPGDSGALVLNGHGQGVGTVIAMGSGGITYISPLGPALDHAKEILGREVGRSVTVEYI